LVGKDELGNDLHHTWQSVGEPLCGELPGELRDECLNCEAFANLEETRVVMEVWREEYNTQRPHSSLGYLTPAEFAEQSS